MSLPNNLFITPKQTAKKAMQLLDANGLGILFVVNKKKELEGVLTPGDIRRAIDLGFDIKSSVLEIMNKEPLTINDGLSPKKCIASIAQTLAKREKEVDETIQSVKIPVISSRKQVVDVMNFIQNKQGVSLTYSQVLAPLENGDKKVLIVGGAGFLGSILSRLLLDAGYQVRVLDSLSFGEESIQDLLENPNFTLVKGDIRDIQVLHKSLHSIDAVIHLAAIVGDPASQKYPQDTIGVNYLATMTLALACKYYQINKFIFASTCSVYGVGTHSLDETSELNPVSLYARTKIESEKGILSLTDENFRPIIMRMGTLYGLSPRMRFDLVVNTFAKTEHKITIFGGDQWRPLLHVRDAARAYLLALESPTTQFKNLVFNVGSDEQNYTIKQLGSMVQTTIPGTKIELLKQQNDIVADKRTYQVSFDKIKSGLGFSPMFTVPDALSEIHTAITTGNIKNVNDKIYYNVT
jgi:nucleoside-diphosphate-sugar epimerase